MSEEIIQRLDRIIELLEAFIEPACPHENVQDIGTMGVPPGAHVRCEDCGEEIWR